MARLADLEKTESSNFGYKKSLILTQHNSFLNLIFEEIGFNNTARSKIVQYSEALRMAGPFNNYS